MLWANAATALQWRTTRLDKTMNRNRTTSRNGGFGGMRAPMGTDAFNVEFVLQAGACLDWNALSPWMNAVETKLGVPVPITIFKLSLLASWFRLDAHALEHACSQRADFRRFVGAPLHGPIIDVQLYREFEPRLRSARQSLAKLIAAVELQLVDHGFFPPAEVLGRLELQDLAPAASVPTIVQPHSPRAVGHRSSVETAHHIERSAAKQAPAREATKRRALLIWPWGDITVVDRRIRIGRSGDFSEFATHVRADRKVSREHAVIEPGRDGGVLVQDLGSANGTYVGDEPLRYAGSRLLDENAILKFGTDLAVTLAFVAADGHPKV